MTNNITTSNMISNIFRRHAARLRTFGADTDLVRYAMLAALEELAAAMQHDDHGQDALLARIERVLEAHDSALYADVASGRTDLATAITEAVRIALQRGAESERLRILAEAESAQHYTDSVQATLDGIERAAALTQERDGLRQQLAQMDADNAALTKELAILRSYVTAPWVHNAQRLAETAAEIEQRHLSQDARDVIRRHLAEIEIPF